MFIHKIELNVINVLYITLLMHYDAHKSKQAVTKSRRNIRKQREKKKLQRIRVSIVWNRNPFFYQFSLNRIL